jgi:hypothetical protein
VLHQWRGYGPFPVYVNGAVLPFMGGSAAAGVGTHRTTATSADVRRGFALLGWSAAAASLTAVMWSRGTACGLMLKPVRTRSPHCRHTLVMQLQRHTLVMQLQLAVRAEVGRERHQQQERMRKTLVKCFERWTGSQISFDFGRKNVTFICATLRVGEV